LKASKLYLRPEAVPVVEEEARRLGLSKTGMLAEIVEAWARAGVNGAPSRIVTVGQAPSCDRPAGVSGLCRTHRIQEQRGQPLRPIRPKQQEVRMGSLRLPAATAKRLRATARASGLTFNEALRQALAAGLDYVPGLAALEPASRGGETVRLGVLGLPRELAERLNVMAQGFGLPVSEVVRRALRFVTGQGRCLGESGHRMAFALATNELGAQAAARFSGQGVAGYRPASCVQPFAREHWLSITWGDLMPVEFPRGGECRVKQSRALLGSYFVTDGPRGPCQRQ
jgi:predicted DNA-binding protein